MAAMKVGSQSTPCIRLLLLTPDCFSRGEWRKATPRVPPCSLTTDDRSYSWCYQGFNCHQKMFVIFLKKSSFSSSERPVVPSHLDCASYQLNFSQIILFLSPSSPLSVVKAIKVFS